MPDSDKNEPSQKLGRLGKVPQRLIDTGFILGLVLSAACLVVSGVYLFSFLSSTYDGVGLTLNRIEASPAPGTVETLVNGRLVMGRLGLLSCGILVGISFGFLGFALFLLGVRESANLDIDADVYKAKFANMSPGLVVILCSAVLVGVCATRETPFWYNHSQTLTGTESGEQMTTHDTEPVDKPAKDSKELPPKDRLTRP